MELHEAMQAVNIILQSVTLGLIFISWRLKKKGKFVWHGNLMLVAVFVVALMIISHMGPALIGVETDIVANLLNITPIIGLIHASIGIVAIVSGAWLVGNWAYVQAAPNNPSLHRVWVRLLPDAGSLGRRERSSRGSDLRR